MLIEGQLPTGVAVLMPVVPCLFLCSLAISISLLLFSVRFAMVLRFRVGKTIVREMRDAIEERLLISSPAY